MRRACPEEVNRIPAFRSRHHNAFRKPQQQRRREERLHSCSELPQLQRTRMLARYSPAQTRTPETGVSGVFILDNLAVRRLSYLQGCSGGANSQLASGCCVLRLCRQFDVRPSSSIDPLAVPGANPPTCIGCCVPRRCRRFDVRLTARSSAKKDCRNFKPVHASAKPGIYVDRTSGCRKPRFWPAPLLQTSIYTARRCES